MFGAGAESIRQVLNTSNIDEKSQNFKTDKMWAHYLPI